MGKQGLYFQTQQLLTSLTAAGTGTTYVLALDDRRIAVPSVELGIAWWRKISLTSGTVTMILDTSPDGTSWAAFTSTSTSSAMGTTTLNASSELTLGLAKYVRVRVTVMNAPTFTASSWLMMTENFQAT